MAQKSQEKGVAGPAPVVDEPGRVRNVVLVGHSSAGKTTLVEALLGVTGTISRVGSVTDGTTVSDHDPAAVKQQRSVALACAPVLHEGVKVNLLDTPGYADFVGELRAGLRAADAALFVVSSVDGMDAATAALWEECAAVGMPRAVAVTRLDHQRSDFDETLAVCQRVFGDNVMPLYLPLHGDDGTSVAGLIGLISQRVYDYTNEYPPQVREPDAEHLPAIEEARNALLEGIIAESEDESLMDRYLGGEELEPSLIVEDLEKAVARGTFYPVIPVCAETRVGLDALLEVLTSAFPSPLEHPLPPVTGIDGTPRDPLTCDPNGPLVAEVVKTTIDPYVGRVSLVRVFSGTLRPEQVVHISGHGMAERGHPDHDADERFAHLYSPLGANVREVPFCMAGDICAITKSSTAETGDTISSKEQPLLMAPWEMPEPLLPAAIVAKTRSDEDALAKNLGRHVKQSGAHGQYAVCDIEVEPLPRGSGFEFVDRIVGGVVPNNYIPSVEKGVRAQMERGIAAGYPVVDLRVTLFDGKAHSVDSSDAAFQTAGGLALKDAAEHAQIQLLEPVDEVTIRVPEQFVGAVMSDMSGRRGRLLGTESDGDKSVIRAEVPATELVRYAVELRAMTSGAGGHRLD